MPATPKPKITVKATPKVIVKATPKPSYSAPSLADYKKSAAYKNSDMTYKEYLKASKDAYNARMRKK